MKELKDHLDYGSDRKRVGRPPAEDKDEYPEDKWYSIIFHSITRKLGLNSSLKIMVFGNIEGLSRKNRVCVIRSTTLARMSGCTEPELLQILEEFQLQGLIEKGSNHFKVNGWKLTPTIRDLVEPIRREFDKRSKSRNPPH